MSLKEYNQKRKFSETPEPKGEEEHKGKDKKAPPRFVVQEHHASRLHYDFRLELEGVLVSWAVPKEPSMNPEEKRLAIKVEDHPLSYIDFAGTIPEGNYGAGEVYIWDRGFYHSTKTKDLNKNEKSLVQGLNKGHLEILLMGERLKGLFSLVKIKGTDNENSWLLIKQKDEFAQS